jgi:hypothetical protein
MSDRAKGLLNAEARSTQRKAEKDNVNWAREARVKGFHFSEESARPYSFDYFL